MVTMSQSSYIIYTWLHYCGMVNVIKYMHTYTPWQLHTLYTVYMSLQEHIAMAQ